MPKDLYYIDSIYRRDGSDQADGYITLLMGKHGLYSGIFS